MAMENLLRIANRTEDLPDQALAQLAKAGGIEGVIAASEMKARSDIRKDAQMPQQGQMPPVVDQLINMANRQAAPQMPPMGQPMPPQMPPQMGQQMPPQMPPQGMPMPQGISPELAALASQGGIPAMQAGGLIRRFQAGSQGTIGGNQQYMDALSQFLGYDPQAILSGNVQVPSGFNLSQQQLDDLQSQYEDAMAGTGVYTPQVKAEDDAYRSQVMNLMSGTTMPNPITRQQAKDNALQQARQQAVSTLFSQSGLPQGAIQSRSPVGSQTQVQALIPGGGQGTVLPQGYSAMAAAASQPPSSQPSSQTTTTTPNAVSGPINNQQITPQMYMNAISGPQGGQSGTQVDTDASPDVAIAQATRPFNALYNPIGEIAPYEQSPQYAKDTALLRQMQSSQVTVNGLQGDLLKTLQEREKKYNKDVDDSVQRLADLEKDLPTRQNIKDRLKKQTSLGMAQAFFQAAGSKSPDFITAISQGLAGASGVMNKMTGEEQKELYAHALAEFQREQGKANTAFKRQENAMKKITDAQTFQATIASANRTARNQVAKMQQDGYYNAMRLNVDIKKANQADVLARNNISREEYDRFRDDVRAAKKNRDDFGIAANDVDQDSKRDADQRVLANDIGNSYANQYVRGAQMNINKGLKRVVSDLSQEYNRLAKQIPDPQERMAAARAALLAKHQAEGAIGDMAVLDEYAEDIFDLSTAKDKAAAYKRFYQRPKNSFLNPKILAYNLTP